MHGVLVHEWIDDTGGSEKVLDAMAEAFPDADIHCLWSNAPQRFQAGRVKETWLSRSPFRRNKAVALPLMPWTWRALKSNTTYDWMLVSSHLFAHHAHFPWNSRLMRKYIYVHTPARYIWVPELDARGNHPLARIMSPALRWLDRRRAQDPSISIVANSHFVRERIRAAWGRDSSVIYPPVDVSRIQSVKNWRTMLTPDELAILDALPERFVLGASRFIPYKRLDLVIEAASAAAISVVIAGSGPDEAALRATARRAGADAHFIIRPRSEFLYALYQSAVAYVFPPVEDFGIMPVEAMAAGTPIIAYRVGGAAESVVDGVTGLLVSELSKEAFAVAIASVPVIDREKVRQHAKKFSKERFKTEIRSWINAAP